LCDLISARPNRYITTLRRNLGRRHNPPDIHALLGIVPTGPSGSQPVATERHGSNGCQQSSDSGSK